MKDTQIYSSIVFALYFCFLTLSPKGKWDGCGRWLEVTTLMFLYIYIYIYV